MCTALQLSAPNAGTRLTYPGLLEAVLRTECAFFSNLQARRTSHDARIILALHPDTFLTVRDQHLASSRICAVLYCLVTWYNNLMAMTCDEMYLT